MPGRIACMPVVVSAVSVDQNPLLIETLLPCTHTQQITTTTDAAGAGDGAGG